MDEKKIRKAKADQCVFGTLIYFAEGRIIKEDMKKLKQNIAKALCVSLVVNSATPVFGIPTDFLSDPSVGEISAEKKQAAKRVTEEENELKTSGSSKATPSNAEPADVQEQRPTIATNSNAEKVNEKVEEDKAGDKAAPETVSNVKAQEEKEVSFTFDANGGAFEDNTTSITDTVTLPGIVIVPYVTAPKGKIMTGWYTGKTGGKRVIIGDYDGKYELDLEKLDGATTLYAHFEEKGPISLTFNANGGTFEEGKTEVAVEAIIAEEIEFPYVKKAAGYKLSGWYTQAEGGDLLFNGDEEWGYITYELLNGATTLYAHWEEDPSVKEVELTFDANGGSFGSDKTLTDKVIVPGKIKAPSVEWAGHKLDGWYTQAEGGEIVLWPDSDWQTLTPKNIDGDTTLYAHWTETTTLDLSFNANAGEFTSGQTTVTNSVTLPDSIAIPVVKERKGYQILGWFTEPEGGTQIIWGNPSHSYLSTEQLAGATTLYAHWKEAVTVELTFDANGGTLASGAQRLTNTVTLPGRIQIPALQQREGYILEGWYTEPEGGSQILCGDHPEYDVSIRQLDGVPTLYAHWEKIMTIDLGFNANGGTLTSGKESITKEVTLPDVIEIPLVKEREGYQMLGWFTEPEGGTQIVWGNSSNWRISAEQLAGAATLYAHWKKVETVEFTFDANEGRFTYGEESVTRTVTLPDSFQMPELREREGYRMTGWYTERTGGTKIFDAGATGRINITEGQFTGTVTLYAHWEKTVTIDLTFDANGGRLASGEENITGTVILPDMVDIPAVKEWADYTMMGWFTEKTGGTKVFDADTTGQCYVTPEQLAGATTLYAHWVKTSSLIKLTFNANGGTLESGEETITNEVSIPAEILIPKVKERPGCRMTGWYTAPEGGTQVIDGNYGWWCYITPERLNGANTLYAQWEEATYTVSFRQYSNTLKSVTVKEGETVEDPGSLGLYENDESTYFIGWAAKDSADGSLYDFSQPVTKDIILEAKTGTRVELPDLQVRVKDIVYNGKPKDDVFERVYYSALEGSAWVDHDLQKDIDYVVDYENNLNAGTATATIRGINKYKGTKTKTFTIRQADISNAEIIFNDNSNGTYEFTGKSIHPDFTIKMDDVVLQEGVDYTVGTEWPKRIGEHRVSLKGIGNYTNYASVNMKIVAAEIASGEAKVNYSGTLYMHVGDSVKLVDVKPEASAALIGSSNENTNIVSLSEDGTLTALNEGETSMTPIVYWKDGTSKYLSLVQIKVIPAAKNIVTIKTIMEESSFIDGTTECLYTSPTDADVYIKQMNVPEGKILRGWYTENGTRVTDKMFLRNPGSDMTLYAKFAKKLTLHFEFGSEATVKNDSYKTRELAEGDSTDLMTGSNSYAYEWEGHTLVGWCLDPECKGPVLTGNYKPEPAEGQSEITLYAKWESSYTITFDPGEDGYFPYDFDGKPIVVQGGHPIGNDLPSDLLSTTGTFDGWFTDDGRRVTRSFIPTGDMTLHARWLKEKTHRVTFHANGSYFNENEKTDEGDTTTATRRVQEGYTASVFVYRPNFECLWYKDEDFKIPYNMEAAVTEDLDLYARWVRRLELNWDADGGVTSSGQSSGRTVAYEGGTCQMPEVTKAGFRFDGWYTEDGQLVTTYTPLTENVSVTARWVPAEQIHISLELDGGELPSYRNQTDLYLNPGDKMDRFVNIAPKKDGTAFLGWATEDGTCYEALSEIPLTGNSTEIKLTAKWTTDYVTVTFDGEESSVYDSFSGQYTNRLSYRVPKGKTWPKWLYEESFDEVGGKTVKGWNTAKGSDSGLELQSMKLAEDTILYPVWSAYWRISFDYMGGFYNSTAGNQKSITVARGETLNSFAAKQMSKPGCQFAGWYETPDYTGPQVEIPFVPERNMMLYAKWTEAKPITYTVTFNTDPTGAAGETFTREVPQGTPVTKPADPEKTGYAFAGWYQDAACTVKYDFAAGVYDNLTLFAKWAEIKDLKNATISVARAVYNGQKQEPEITVQFGENQILTKGTDYTVEYPEVPENTNAGTGYAVIKGINNYSGEVTKYFEILKAAASAAEFGIADQVYEGVYGGKLSETAPALPKHWSWAEPDMVFDQITGNTSTTFPADFTTYDGCNYDSAVNVPLKVRIAPRELKDSDVTLAEKVIYYTGEQCRTTVTVISNGKTLQENTDYTVTYRNNTEIGTATVMVKGTGNYTGTVTETFQITSDPYDLRGAQIILTPSSVSYTGKEIRPDITVSLAGKILKEGTDYTVSYGTNINAGEGSVTITGLNGFNGTIEKKFTIERIENPAEIPETAFNAVYGQKLKTLQLPNGWFFRSPDAAVGAVGENRFEIYLPETQNYHEKTAYVTIRVTQKEAQEDMLKAELSGIVYNGSEVKPKISLVDGDYMLTEGVDYTVSYRDNLHAGKAVMVITLRGNYSGVIEKEFMIEQAEASITVGAGLNIQCRLQQGTIDLNAVVSGNGELQYTSTNPAVATVDEDGVVTLGGLGSTTVTVIFMGDRDYKPVAVSVTLTVTRASAQQSSGSDSDSDRDHESSGGSFVNKTPNAAKDKAGAAVEEQTKIYNGIALPMYVNVESDWKQTENGTWTLLDTNGEPVRNQWMAVYDSKADIARGEDAYKWYRFDGNGQMMIGWYVDELGDIYYLNPTEGDMQGGMMIGWNEIKGKWYYFNNQSDGTRGKLLKNTTTPDGYYVKEDGSWDENSNK